MHLNLAYRSQYFWLNQLREKTSNPKNIMQHFLSMARYMYIYIRDGLQFLTDFQHWENFRFKEAPSPLASHSSRPHPRGADLRHQKRLGRAIGANERPLFGIEEVLYQTFCSVWWWAIMRCLAQHLELTRSRSSKIKIISQRSHNFIHGGRLFLAPPLTAMLTRWIWVFRARCTSACYRGPGRAARHRHMKF